MWRQKRLVRILVEKDELDRKLFSTEQICNWYSVDHCQLGGEARNRFLSLQMDEETNEFLSASLIISNSFCLQVYYSLFTSLLSVFLAKTSINGLLHRGRMFIFSHSHLKVFLAIPDDWSPIGRQLLDIGAGDGAVTAKFASFFASICVVEASKVMEWRLARRGFTVLPMDKWQRSGPYSLITALNLLDRHHVNVFESKHSFIYHRFSDPKKLLNSLRELAIEHNCPILLSVVLPIRQFVEFDDKIVSAGRKLPASDIPTKGTTFEAQVNSMIQNVLEPNGFEVIRWTKLPYLCEGDLSRAYYVLDDAVFLLNAMPYHTHGEPTILEYGVTQRNEL
ncbi:hypothetical protein niasHT_007904 [Heterodera trifolii]|uniref:DREV methyltransferase n=1 Tax=Heterodera trifolii TaxID=157864 RepID=A0ABD2M0H8_9BILA